MTYVTQNSLHKKVNFTLRKTNGGFIRYVQLLIQFFAFVYQNREMMPFWQRTKLFAFMVLKTPYYLLIKPFGWFFSVKEVLKGSFKAMNGKITFSNVKKSKTFYVIGIPYFFWMSKPNKEDWEKMLKD